MKRLTITRTNGGVPKAAATDDHVSALVMYLPLDTVEELCQAHPGCLTYLQGCGAYAMLAGTLQEVEQAGIVPDSPQWELRYLYYQVSEVFRTNPSCRLYLMLAATKGETEARYPEITALQEWAGGRIRQMAVCDYYRKWSTTMAASVTGEAEGLELQGMPLSILYTCILDKATESYLADGGSRMSLVAGQDLTRMSLYGLHDNESHQAAVYVACVGTVLGLLSRAKVHQCIAWVRQFDTGIECPGIFGMETREVGQAKLELYDSRRLIYAAAETGQSGTYLNDSHTLDKPDSDYSAIECVRTMDKAVRGLRADITPELGGCVYLDADTGQMQPYSVQHLQNVASRTLEQMLKDGEISGYSVQIDAGQDVLSTGRIDVVLKIVPVGIARNISCTIGFAKSLE